jgi:hypothetical protein
MEETEMTASVSVGLFLTQVEGRRKSSDGGKRRLPSGLIGLRVYTCPNHISLPTSLPLFISVSIFLSHFFLLLLKK